MGSITVRWATGVLVINASDDATATDDWAASVVAPSNASSDNCVFSHSITTSAATILFAVTAARFAAAAVTASSCASIVIASEHSSTVIGATAVACTCGC